MLRQIFGVFPVRVPSLGGEMVKLVAKSSGSREVLARFHAKGRHKKWRRCAVPVNIAPLGTEGREQFCGQNSVRTPVESAEDRGKIEAGDCSC